MRGIKGSKKPEMALCHPERRNRALGQCGQCWRRDHPSRASKCHPERQAAGRGLCKKCYNALLFRLNPAYAERTAEYKRRWGQARKDDLRLRNRLKARLWTLKKFGLTAAAYFELLEQQGRACAICRNKKEVTSLQVDHDHKTGRVRGLLCRKCNLALGHADDSVETLERAIQYLKGELRYNAGEETLAS